MLHEPNACMMLKLKLTETVLTVSSPTTAGSFPFQQQEAVYSLTLASCLPSPTSVLLCRQDCKGLHQPAGPLRASFPSTCARIHTPFLSQTTTVDYIESGGGGDTFSDFPSILRPLTVREAMSSQSQLHMTYSGHTVHKKGGETKKNKTKKTIKYSFHTTIQNDTERSF